MSPHLLLESIRLHDGQIDLLDYHQRRMDRSRRALFPKARVLHLDKIIASLELPAEGTHKIRLQYDDRLRHAEILPYSARPVNALRLVVADTLRYGKKYADRAAIERHFQRRGSADDVLLVQRGYLTDASYANLALYDGTAWYTPAWPLLAGTRREKLIEEGRLRPSIIRARDLHNFESIRLINAMLPWEVAPVVPIAAVQPLAD